MSKDRDRSTIRQAEPEDETVRWEPDWIRACDNCGELPTVTGVDEHGHVTVAPGLCGACCWGESALTDPALWND